MRTAYESHSPYAASFINRRPLHVAIQIASKGEKAKLLADNIQAAQKK